MITFISKIENIFWVLMLAFGVCTCVGTVDGVWNTQFVLAAAADATPAEKGGVKSGEKAPVTKSKKPGKAAEKAPEPETEKMPFKTFVPSERIEPDHAVDFPADI
jgi:hypothetical protein